MNKQLYEDEKAAEILGVSASWLRKRRGPKALPGGPNYIKIGNAVRYTEDALAEFLEQNTVNGGERE